MALPLMVTKQPGLRGAILYDFIFVGGSCIRVRSFKIEIIIIKNLALTSVACNKRKVLGSEKESQNLMLELFSISAEKWGMVWGAFLSLVIMIHLVK